MAVSEARRDFWSAFAQACGGAEEARFCEAFAFGDSSALPRPGGLSIVTSGAGVPLCVIETLAVDIVPLDQVSADFAAAEGEGDGSLAFWCKAHEACFSRECARLGRRFEPGMPVVCERFRLRYPPAGG